MKTVLRILNLMRLVGYPFSYGITGALVGGALNRLMVAELGFSMVLILLVHVVVAVLRGVFTGGGLW